MNLKLQKLFSLCLQLLFANLGRSPLISKSYFEFKPNISHIFKLLLTEPLNVKTQCSVMFTIAVCQMIFIEKWQTAVIRNLLIEFAHIF